jgi:hypothetical protein
MHEQALVPPDRRSIGDMLKLPKAAALTSDHVDDAHFFDFDQAMQSVDLFVAPSDDTMKRMGFAVRDVADRTLMLDTFWQSGAYAEWHAANVEVSWQAYWACRPVNRRAEAARLIRDYAPGAALVGLPGAPEYRAFGLTTVVCGPDLSAGEFERLSSLSLAKAFVCCGHVPPHGLVRSALQHATDQPLEPEIAAGFRLSLAEAKRRLDVALVNFAAATAGRAPPACTRDLRPWTVLPGGLAAGRKDQNPDRPTEQGG